MILVLLLLLFLSASIAAAWNEADVVPRALDDDVDVAVRLRASSSATSSSSMSRADLALLAARAGYAYVGRLFGEYHVFRHHGGRRLGDGEKNASFFHVHQRRAAERMEALSEWIEWHAVQERQRFVRRDLFSEPLDGGLKEQWFLNGTAVAGQRPLAHANVGGAWAQGVQGQGVTLCVIDDGVNYRHPDLAANYDAALSYNYVGRNSDPIPTNLADRSNHGTPVASSCCGVNNRAVANNGAVAVANECGVGSAPRARFAAVRDLIVSSDSEVAQVVTHRLADLHIYVLTAGPRDDGRTSHNIGSLAEAAFVRGTEQGRGGKGAVYVFSAGNGGQSGDDCNYDGFVSHRTTVAVGAITAMGQPTYYSEECSSLHTVSPSSGHNNAARGGLSGMYVSDISSCSDNWGGTSGAAPLAAGVVALWLQAVPTLTWLDVQGVLAYSSARARTAASHATSWQLNGAGLFYSHWFGFGVVDATRGLAIARLWRSYTNLALTNSGVLASGTSFSLSAPLRASWTSPAPSTQRVKAVEVYVIASHVRRGDLRVQLRSPAGTVCTLAKPRPRDTGANLNNRFLCNAAWDESPAGAWQLTIEDTKLNAAGTLTSWRVVVHHTDPNNFSESSRPVAVERPPAPVTVFQPTIVVTQPSPGPPGVTPAGTVQPFTLIDAETDGWRFRVGPLHASELAGWRFADIEYGEQSGPNGEQWTSGTAPFGYSASQEREAIAFATTLANTTTSLVLRRTFFLSAAQIAMISRFKLFCASDDYATVFVNGIPLLGEAPPPSARNFAYWNDEKEFGRLVIRAGPNVVSAQVFNRNGSRDMGVDVRLDALLFAGSVFPAPMPVPTPAPTPGTRVSVVTVTDSAGAPATDIKGAPITSVVELPDFTPDSEPTDQPAVAPEPSELPFALGTGVPYLLFILIGVASCFFCVVIICAVVFLQRNRRQRRQRRQVQRGRSRTRLNEYNDVLDREMRNSSSRESATPAAAPVAKVAAAAPAALPAAPDKDRPLPSVAKPIDQDRPLPDVVAKAKLEPMVSARDSPLAARRKTTVLPQPSAPPAEPAAPAVAAAAAAGSKQPTPVGTPQLARRNGGGDAAPAQKPLLFINLDESAVLHEEVPPEFADLVDAPEHDDLPPPPPFSDDAVPVDAAPEPRQLGQSRQHSATAAPAVSSASVAARAHSSTVSGSQLRQSATNHYNAAWLNVDTAADDEMPPLPEEPEQL